FLAYTTHKKEKADSFYLHIRDLKSDVLFDFSPAYTDVQKLMFHADERYLSYFTSSDTSKQKNYSLYLFEPISKRIRLIADTATNFMPTDKAPSIHFSPFVTASENQLFFGMGERSKPEM